LNLGAPTGPRLQCCGGNPAPAIITEGWKAFAELPAAARDSIWELLGQTLLAPGDPENEDRVDGFCTTHDAPPESVLHAVRACDYLIRNASALNLAREVFGNDLVALSPGQPEVSGVIASQ
jgi:hypothetical protein